MEKNNTMPLALTFFLISIVISPIVWGHDENQVAFLQKEVPLADPVYSSTVENFFVELVSTPIVDSGVEPTTTGKPEGRLLEKEDHRVILESSGVSIRTAMVDSSVEAFATLGEPTEPLFESNDPKDLGLFHSDKAGEAQKQIQKGRALLNEGRYEEAIAPLKKALKINPNLADVHFPLGLAYAGLGRHQEKIRHYQEAIRIRPNHGPAHFKLGLHEAAQNHHQEAVNYYKNALKANPKAVRIHYFLGLSLYLSKRYQEAQLAFEQALNLNPTQPEIYYGLGLTYLKSGNYRKAIDPLKQALSLAPNLLDKPKE